MATLSDYERLIRKLKGEDCVCCGMFPEEHGEGGKCLFESTHFTENTHRKEAYATFEKVKQQLGEIEMITKVAIPVPQPQAAKPSPLERYRAFISNGRSY